MPKGPTPENPLDSADPSIYDVRAQAPGPPGELPITADDLLRRPSGDLFGYTQNVGMGLAASEIGRPEVLILGTAGGIREPDGRPVALGYHTGHWEIGLLMEEAARELRRKGCQPF
ncbi:MAG TPA: YjhG/YagF family D-xylonate dehydratase, partial [Polyangia bacterium]